MRDGKIAFTSPEKHILFRGAGDELAVDGATTSDELAVDGATIYQNKSIDTGGSEPITLHLRTDAPQCQDQNCTSIGVVTITVMRPTGLVDEMKRKDTNFLQNLYQRVVTFIQLEQPFVVEQKTANQLTLEAYDKVQQAVQKMTDGWNQYPSKSTWKRVDIVGMRVTTTRSSIPLSAGGVGFSAGSARRAIQVSITGSVNVTYDKNPPDLR